MFGYIMFEPFATSDPTLCGFSSGLPGPALKQRQQATVVNGTAVTQRVFMRLLHDIWTQTGFLPSQTKIHLRFVHSEVRQVAFKNKLIGIRPVSLLALFTRGAISELGQS